MKLRFKVPFSADVIGATAEALELSSNFDHKGLPVHVLLEGGEPQEAEQLPRGRQFFRSLTFLQFEITFPRDNQKFDIEQLLNRDGWSHLVKLLLEIINRVLRAIRNFGIVTHIMEVTTEGRTSERQLFLWHVESSEDGVEWQPVAPPLRGFEALVALFSSRARNTPELLVINWPGISEAIQDDLDPPPEQEFMTNAVEFLRLGNLRMAVIESIIGLELVLDRYLKTYLIRKAKIEKNRVVDFVKPQLGLKDRVAVVLELTLNATSRTRVSFDDVLKVVGWRNKIVHHEGRLPDAPREMVAKGIVSVVALTHMLANECRQIDAAPDLLEIARHLAEQHGVPLPRFDLRPDHRVSMHVVFFGPPLSLERLQNLCQEAGERLRGRDPRFDPQQHLLASFTKFPNEPVGRWNGEKVVPEK